MRMEYRILGSTGLKISAVGFGAWGIGGAMWGSPDDDKGREALAQAFKHGITFYDTALAYGEGHSENLVGELAKKHPEIIIATKVPPKNSEWRDMQADIKNAFPKEWIIECAKKSYNNLGDRQIDLLQLHAWTDHWVNEPGWIEALEELREENIIRFFGVSVNSHAPETALKLAASGKIHSLQVIHNIFDQSPEDELFSLAKKHDVGIISRCPFDEGSLTGTFTKETRFTDWRKDYFTPQRIPEVVERIDALRWLETPTRTLPQAALQFCLAHPAVSTVIPGMRSPNHVAENAAAADSTLTGDERERLKEHRWERYFYS